MDPEKTQPGPALAMRVSPRSRLRALATAADTHGVSPAQQTVVPKWLVSLLKKVPAAYTSSKPVRCRQVSTTYGDIHWYSIHQTKWMIVHRETYHLGGALICEHMHIFRWINSFPFCLILDLDGIGPVSGTSWYWKQGVSMSFHEFLPVWHHKLGR